MAHALNAASDSCVGRTNGLEGTKESASSRSQWRSACATERSVSSGALLMSSFRNEPPSDLQSCTQQQKTLNLRIEKRMKALSGGVEGRVEYQLDHLVGEVRAVTETQVLYVFQSGYAFDYLPGNS